MDTPVEEQQVFHKVTCNIAASEDEMTEPNMLSEDFIQSVSYGLLSYYCLVCSYEWWCKLYWLKQSLPKTHAQCWTKGPSRKKLVSQEDQHETMLR